MHALGECCYAPPDGPLTCGSLAAVPVSCVCVSPRRPACASAGRVRFRWSALPRCGHAQAAADARHGPAAPDAAAVRATLNETAHTHSQSLLQLLVLRSLSQTLRLIFSAPRITSSLRDPPLLQHPPHPVARSRFACFRPYDLEFLDLLGLLCGPRRTIKA